MICMSKKRSNMTKEKWKSEKEILKSQKAVLKAEEAEIDAKRSATKIGSPQRLALTKKRAVHKVKLDKWKAKMASFKAEKAIWESKQ